MTPTDLRETFTVVADAVPVPPPDRVSFQRGVVDARRKRRSVRGLTALAAVAAVAVGVTVAVLPDGGDRTQPPAVSPAPAAGYLPVVLDGELAVLGPDWRPERTGLRVLTLVGRGDNGVVVVRPDKHLVVAPASADGVGKAHDLAGELVEDAAISADGRSVGWVDQGRTLHLRGQDGAWSWSFDSAAQSGFYGHLLATDGAAWVALDADGIATLADKQTGVPGPVVLDPLEDARGAQLAGDTIAVQTRGGASFFDADSGERRLLDLGGAVGGLSTDGARWATATAAWQSEAGMSPMLSLVDTHSGDMHPVHGYDEDQQALAVWWSDADRFAVVTQDGERRVLWDCSAKADRCSEAYDDPTGTLRLPGQP